MRDLLVPGLLTSPGADSVLFVTGSLGEESSGPYLTLKQTTRELKRRGHRVTVIGTRRAEDDPSSRWPVEAHAFRSYGPFSLHYAPGLARWLRRQPAEWDVASMQGIWLHTNRVVADWCTHHRKPFMISTHGNFNPTALKIAFWKKWLARHAFMTPVFEHVTCYQAGTEIEYRALREYGIRKPICIIGNGIDLPDLDRLPAPESILPKGLQARRTCLYLGRLHPIKGIDRLLRAWGRVRPSDDWQLIIAGTGTDQYREELEAIARQSTCRNVKFIGFVLSEVKAAWLRHAEFFVLPSRSEAFPMAVMEAFSHGVPALITMTCGFPEAAEAGAALEVESNEDAICAGLDHLTALASPRLQAMGETARSFVQERYAWPNICAELESVYRWMTGSGPAPRCLRID